MHTLRITTTITPDGEFHMIIDQNDIVRASGFGSADNLLHRFDSALSIDTIEHVNQHQYQQLITDYYDGNKAALSRIPHRQAGTDFQKSVWNAMSTIPYGQTVSYKALAAASGNPSAIRAAGTICGRSRLILLVPCHRVLKSDGSIGSYLYGPAIKESLLRHEKAIV
ncbi:MAG: methylated-DNA--[protein]-cysteine S-methyltransferase [Chloroflexi bacterium]|nr:MAG: methylated-DNA--[protein]-cysteine S-methyltransferase [Chloroflexota bacterium]